MRHFRRHPFFAQTARITLTGDGHPGDPINIGLVGSEEDVVRAMRAAGWYPADPITFASSVRIAADTVLRRPDDDAPVSNLFLFGRKQDLAFEQPAGWPGQAPHVRFWQWDQLYEGRHGWFGAATFDSKVGLSHTTGQVTHHIAPDVDAERDRLVGELQQAGMVAVGPMAGRLPHRSRGPERRRRSLAHRRAPRDRHAAPVVTRVASPECRNAAWLAAAQQQAARSPFGGEHASAIALAVRGSGFAASSGSCPPHPFRHATCELRRKIAAEKPSPRRGEEGFGGVSASPLSSPSGERTASG